MSSMCPSRSPTLGMFHSSAAGQLTPTPNASTKQAFRFLDLPPELRVSVYNLLIPQKIRISYSEYPPTHQTYRRPVETFWRVPPDKFGRINFKLPYHLMLANHLVSSEFQHELSRREFLIEEPRQNPRAGRALPAWLTRAMKDVRLDPLDEFHYEVLSPGCPPHILLRACQEHAHGISRLASSSASPESELRALWTILHLRSLSLVLRDRCRAWFDQSTSLFVDYQLPKELPSIIYDMMRAGKLRKLHVGIERGSLDFINRVFSAFGLPTASYSDLEDDSNEVEKSVREDGLDLRCRLRWNF